MSNSPMRPESEYVDLGLDHDHDHGQLMDYENDTTPLQGHLVEKAASEGPQAVRNELWGHLNWRNIFHRERFLCAFFCTAFAFLVTALLPFLRKGWLLKGAQTNESHVSTLKGFRWVNAWSTILSQGIPRAAWVVIGDTVLRSYAERIRLSYTLVAFQVTVGVVITGIMSFSAEMWVGSNLTPESAEQTLQYVMLSIYSTLPSGVEAALAVCTRALDRPDVSVLISGVNFLVNLSICAYIRAYPDAEQWGRPDLITTHTRVALVGDTLSVLSGFIYFILTAVSWSPQPGIPGARLRPSLTALWVLLVPGSKTLLEACLRTLLGLAAESAIGPMRLLHKQAYAAHNQLRETLMMVHARAFEATALTFMSHNWSTLRAAFGGRDGTFMRISISRICILLLPVFIAIVGTFSVEVTSTIIAAANGLGDYVWTWASHTSDVGEMVTRMWRSWSAMYVFYVVGLQLAVILLATKPGWWLGAGLATQILFVIPSIVADATKDIREDHVWEYYGSVFVGSRVFWFFCVLGAVGFWLWCIRTGWRGWLKFDHFRKA